MNLKKTSKKLKCSRCKEEYPADEFPIKKSGRREYWCRSCRSIASKKFYDENKEQMLAKQKERYNKIPKETVRVKSKAYRDEHKDEYNSYCRDRYAKDKLEFISMYGGVCECCGEKEPIFLTIDHTNGQVGKKKKETGQTAYRNAVATYPNPEYRILCMNCNSAVRFGRICPHQK